MIPADAAANVAIVGDTLAEIQEHRAGRIRCAHFFVIVPYFFGFHWRSETSAPLRIIRFVSLHPADYERIGAILCGGFNWFANDAHPGFGQCIKLLLSRTFPEADVQINTSGL